MNIIQIIEIAFVASENCISFGFVETDPVVVALELGNRTRVLFTLMPGLTTGLLGLSSLLTLLLFFLASFDVSRTLSPQGCRMSWMSPSYVLQTGFSAAWSPLARRYTLWLYREVGWDSMQVNTD